MPYTQRLFIYCVFACVTMNSGAAMDALDKQFDLHDFIRLQAVKTRIMNEMACPQETKTTVYLTLTTGDTLVISRRSYTLPDGQTCTRDEGAQLISHDTTSETSSHTPARTDPQNTISKK